MNILISGSIAYDRIMNFPGKFEDHILADNINMLNVCFVVDSVVEKFGGTAGNIAYNLALLQEQPLILSAVGKDFDPYAEWLRQNGLSLKGVRRIDDTLTAGCYITSDKSGNQITVFNPGAMQYPSLFQLEGHAPADTIAIVSPGNAQDMLDYSRAYKQRNIPYIFDPGQQIPMLSKEQLMEMMTGAYILIVNEYELQMIENDTGLEKHKLFELTGTLVVTRGEKGSVICTPQKEFKVPAAGPLRVLDPTGAGDAYRAGLIKGIIKKQPLEIAARMGAVSASFCVQEYGTQAHRFSNQAFQRRYEENFGVLAL